MKIYLKDTNGQYSELSWYRRTPVYSKHLEKYIRQNTINFNHPRPGEVGKIKGKEMKLVAAHKGCGTNIGIRN